MKNLLTKLGITQAGHFLKDGTYVVEFESDSEYNKVFSKLDRSELLEEDPEAGSVTLSTAIVSYIAEGYTLTLISNFDNNTYELRVTEMKGQKIDG